MSTSGKIRFLRILRDNDQNYLNLAPLGPRQKKSLQKRIDGLQAELTKQLAIQRAEKAKRANQ